MGMYRNRMPDRELSAEMTKANYWEVQADMWHQNYKEAANEIERLREALRHMLRWHDQLSLADIAKAKAALKEKE